MTKEKADMNSHSGLSDRQQALLEKLLKGGLSPHLEKERIPVRKIQSPTPLSYAQQRLWVLDRLVPGNPFYNIPGAYRLKGKIDIPVLQRSLDEIIRRHETLRTIFSMDSGTDEPVQVILQQLEIKIDIYYLDDLPAEQQNREILRLAETEAANPFDLSRGPLLRTTLLSCAGDDHVLLFTMHHIISDGWSLNLFIREFSILYTAFLDGRPSPLPPLPIQYADFALWQRNWLQGKVLEKQLSYWRDLLSGELPALELPTDRQRPAVPTYRGGFVPVELPETLSAALTALNLRENCTMFMTLLTAFNIMLYRWCSQEDILVGSPIANRSRTELEALIGFFANTLVFRTRLSGKHGFRELLAQVRSVTSGAYDNQDLPFEKLVEEFQPARYMSHTPFFQVMFNFFESEEKTGTVHTGLQISPLQVHNKTSKFDLWLTMHQSGKKVWGGIEYNSDVFREDSVSRFTGHFKTLLAAIAADPDMPIEALPILPGEERELLLEKWNDTGVEYDIRPLHHLFSCQVERSPGAASLVFSHHQLSYAELHRQAGLLARSLLELGVQPGMLVGVFMERSLEMVIALMGILKAGGAYLPLDPEYPRDRLTFMIKDAAISILLTTHSLKQEVKKFRSRGEALPFCSYIECFAPICVRPPGKTIVPDDTKPGVGARRAVPLEPATCNLQPVTSSPELLAYVIYTSGSTGKPKGAAVSHAGICNRLLWMQERYGLTTADRVLQKTPFSFDVSVWEFFWPLLTGAALIMARPGGHKDSAYLKEIVQKEKITTMHFVPSMLQVFLEEPGLKETGSLKRVICSGEALPVAFRQRFFQVFPAGVELHNLYGPTEASVDVTSHQCRSSGTYRTIPIGRPLANTQIYILDRHENPVPIGIPGEIHIAGIQLARGYLNNSELTAEKFIKAQAASFNFQRAYMSYTSYRSYYYKTGDLGRWLPDGAIEFIGRVDFQVKVRGFRIELGEIEASLRSCPDLENAAVITTGSRAGQADNKLAAYITLNRDYMQENEEKTNRSPAAEQVHDWQDVFNDTYKEYQDQADPTFNISGWNSSYTGEPIPADEMRQWVDHTVRRILSLQPRRIMEIGCGTGLFLFPLIPLCEYFLGTDIAAAGLDYIEKQLQHLRSKDSGSASWAEVELRQQPAHNFDNIAPQSLDLVIMNSVVQYFPSLDYLLQVLHGAVKSLKPGGCIFLGDVRNLSLLKAFHASVAVHKAGADNPDTSRDQLYQKVINLVAREKELVISPGFFRALNSHLTRISHSQVLLKRGPYLNELNKFRYDVILHISREDEPVPQVNPSTRHWHKDNLSLPEVHRLLAEENPPCLQITGVPDARTAADRRILNRLETVPENQANSDEPGCTDPEEFWELEKKYPYSVYISPSQFNSPGPAGENSIPAFTYDVNICRIDPHNKDSRLAAASAAPACSSFHRGGREPAPLHTYTNNPLLSRISADLSAKLREYLKERLPEYMVPSYFILLESLPLTPSGKLNRRALPYPEPVTAGADQDKALIAPRNETEILFANIWSQVLELEEIGINNNFFELGGDSIDAIRVISRTNRHGYGLTIQDLYRNQTVADLSAAAGRDNKSQPVPAPVKETGAQTGIPAEIPGTNGMFPVDRDEITRWLPKGIEIEDIYPATPLQCHMVNVLQHYPEPEPPVFIFQRIHPPMQVQVDIPALEQTVQRMVDIYPLLRTVLYLENLPEPVQVVCKNVKSSLLYRDLSNLAQDRQQEEIRALMKAEWQRAINREYPFPLRLCVIKLSGELHQYFVTCDYPRVDGWGSMFFYRGIPLCYEAVTAGRLYEPETNDYYKTYLYNLKKKDPAKARHYWQSLFRDYNRASSGSRVSLFPGSETGEETGFARQHRFISTAATTRLDDFLRRNRLVLSSVIQAVWGLILGAYTGKKDVVFGFLTTGRSVASGEVEAMIGHSINILPVRIRLPGEEPLVSWLHRIMAGHIEWTQYEYTRIEKIYEWLEQNPAQPLFDIFIVVQNIIREMGKSGRSSGTTLFESFFAKMEYPIRIDVYPGARLEIMMNYYRRHVNDSVIWGLLENFKILIEALAAQPGCTVNELFSRVQPRRHPAADFERQNKVSRIQ